MKHRHRLALTGFVACVLFFGACKSEQARASAPASTPAAPASTPASTPAPDSAPPPRAAQAIVQSAWLRERLPEHTVAYLRIPSAWGLLSAPNGRPLDPALASEAHARIIAALRDAVRKDKTIADAGLAPALNLLLGDLDAPVEIAIVDPGDMLNLASSTVLISARLDVASVDALNERLAALGKGGSLLKAPLDATGKGALANGGFLRFDAASRRLHMVGGLTATSLVMDQLLKQLDQTRAHPLHDIERQIDTSGQGLFGWVSLKGVTGMISAQLPEQPGAALLRDLLDKSQSLAFGWGTVEGRHGRLQVRLEAPQAKLLGYLAARHYRTDIKTAGKPRWVVSLMLPDAERLTAFEGNLTVDFGDEASKTYRDAVTLLREQYGIALVELLQWVGPELIAFEDANGRFSALRVNDRQAFYGKLEQLSQRFHWRRETLRVGKAEVQHLTLTGMNSTPDKNPNDAADKDAAFLALLERMNSHFYWIENGSWLVFAEVPQALADRAATELDTELGNWMKQSQGYVPEHALLGISAVTQNAQRNVYYAYLGGLQILGDLLGAPVSLADMPSAGALKLPVEGAIGLALDVTPNRIGLSVSYEQTPVEVLLGSDGGAMTGVAIVGILAAIAIPAYQDYTVRAQVSGVLADSGVLKQAMAEYYAEHGKLPESEDSLEFGFQEGDSSRYLEGYGIDGGAIVLNFGDQADAAIKGNTLLLTPYLGANGTLIWVCGYASVPTGAKPLVRAIEYVNDIPPKYLPNVCR